MVRFNAKMLSQNLQKSKEKYIKKLKEDPYLTHFESSTLVQGNKKSQNNLKSCKGAEIKEIKFEGNSQIERMTGILKLLKKEVPFRSRPKKPTNPEAMYMTSRNF